jgi:F420-dependent oxidoreductase-like protein
MRIGLQVIRFDWPGGPAQIGTKLAEIAQAAEHAGFYSLWVMDHFFQLEPIIGKAEDPMLEGYSTLCYLAGKTEIVRLGTLVTGVVYRHPGLLINTATNLDVLSGGRAYLGIGAAWYEREALGLGFPFPPLKERFERLEETLQITKQVWSGDFAPFNGKHYQLTEPINNPQPLSKPHPPIMVGGGGEKKTLRLVAQYADACNLIVRGGLDEIARKLDVLKGHCDDVGRPYVEIERTVLTSAHIAPGEMSPSDVIDTCRQLATIGVQHVIINMPNVHEITPLEVFGQEIIPAVASL